MTVVDDWVIARPIPTVHCKPSKTVSINKTFRMFHTIKETLNLGEIMSIYSVFNVCIGRYISYIMVPAPLMTIFIQ